MMRLYGLYGPNPIQLIALEKEIRTQTHRGRPREDKRRRQRAASLGEMFNFADTSVQEVHFYLPQL